MFFAVFVKKHKLSFCFSSRFSLLQGYQSNTVASNTNLVSEHLSPCYISISHSHSQKSENADFCNVLTGNFAERQSGKFDVICEDEGEVLVGATNATTDTRVSSANKFYL